MLPCAFNAHFGIPRISKPLMSQLCPTVLPETPPASPASTRPDFPEDPTIPNSCSSALLKKIARSESGGGLQDPLTSMKASFLSIPIMVTDECLGFNLLPLSRFLSFIPMTSVNRFSSENGANRHLQETRSFEALFSRFTLSCPSANNATKFCQSHVKSHSTYILILSSDRASKPARL
ncbi:hypothetical protein BJX99DRAFT_28434 [Aspergillus californicus]